MFTDKLDFNIFTALSLIYIYFLRDTNYFIAYINIK